MSSTTIAQSETVICKPFNKLTLDELYKILRLRSEVFIVEQDCVYQDVDDNDQDALHLWMTIDGKWVAYARVLPAGTYFDEIGIGRVITLERGKGYGLQIFREAMNVAEKYFKAESILIRAQLQAEHFYEKAGFYRVGEPFMYEGLMHVDMRWKKA